MKPEHRQSIEVGREIVTIRSFEEIEKIRSIWEGMQRNEPFPAPNADITRYLSVIDSIGEKVKPYITVLRRSGQPEAMLIGRIQRIEIPYRIGYKTLLKFSLRSLSVVYGGIIGQPNPEVSTMLVLAVMRTLRKGEADVVFFNSLKVDSPMYQAAKKQPCFLCRQHFFRRSSHWRMAIPNSMDQFYQSCSKKHRGNLRRYIRKLDKEYQGQVKVVAYRRQNEMGTAIRAAAQVSSKTYQYALGRGFVDNDRTRSLMTAAARAGWLRAHVMYIRDEPCSFQFGLQYGRTYFLEQIGFDPHWKEFNVGTILFLKALESLCSDHTVDLLDFGFGDAQYKEQYGNERWTESSVQIFAPRLYPVLVNILRTSVMGLNSGSEYVLSKTGSAGWIKKRWRNLVQPGSL